MLGIIPILAFLSFFTLLLNLQGSGGIRQAFLRAAVMWGIYMVFATEMLSLFRAVTVGWLAIAWSVPLLISAIWLARLGRALRWPRLELPKHWLDRSLWFGVLLIIGITALVAWISPPQTWDSLNYHMSRVAHWAEERAVVHYITGIEVQNVLTPGAEMAVLQFYVLSGGDRLVNFISWFAMLGSLIAVSLIAKELGADDRGQLLASIFAASIPMGIIQASSTTTDYVTAFWCACVAAEAVSGFSRKLRLDHVVFASAAAGLSLFTKPMGAMYALPFALLMAWSLISHAKPVRILLWTLLAILISAGVNAGHWTRNYITYGNPIGNETRIEFHGYELYTLPGVTSNIIRNFSMHLGTPFPYVNKGLGVTVIKLHEWINVDINDPRTTSVGVFRIKRTNLGEDIAGNPIQAYTILILTPLILFSRKHWRSRLSLYTILVMLGFVIFCATIKWLPFSSRYHMPLFVLYAPIVSVFIASSLPGHWVRTVGVVFLLGAIPWLTSIEPRPLIPIPDYTSPESILLDQRLHMVFSNGPYLLDPYLEITTLIHEADCSIIGLMLGGNSAEYPLWVLLGAPREDLEVEWIVSGSPSERYRDESFTPCAVICQGCPLEFEQVAGLARIYDQSDYQLFMNPSP